MAVVTAGGLPPAAISAGEKPRIADAVHAEFTAAACAACTEP